MARVPVTCASSGNVGVSERPAREHRPSPALSGSPLVGGGGHEWALSPLVGGSQPSLFVSLRVRTLVCGSGRGGFLHFLPWSLPAALEFSHFLLLFMC